MKKAAVLGYPVAHSLSPRLHGFWLKQAGIEGEYRAIETQPDALQETLLRLREEGYQGCNLTIPHKESALDLMDELSAEAEAIGAVNTVIMREEGSFYGTNTDAFGFMENLRRSVDDVTPFLDHCLILGAGGAAKAIYYGLKHAGAKRISISNRNRARAESFDAQIIDWNNKDAFLDDVTLLVNTTSLGMNKQPPLIVSLESLPNQALVSDIVYQPLVTELLQKAKARGNSTVTGIGMLIYQAAAGFEAWFGVKPDITQASFDLLEEALL